MQLNVQIVGIQKQLVQLERAPPIMRDLALAAHYEYKNYSVGPDAVKTSHLNIHRVLDFILGVNKDNCKRYAPQHLVLIGGYSFGAEEFFENEAKMALRLANFISAFLQVKQTTLSDLKLKLIKKIRFQIQKKCSPRKE